MSITSKALVSVFLTGCLPGPWDYVPREKPEFRGIWTSAYAVADRPVEDVCFERLYSLTEAWTDAFPFYDTAQVTLAGNFSIGGDTLLLQPLANTPNCFRGDSTALFLRGEAYALNARFVWDSAGTRVTTSLQAQAVLPQDLRISD